MPAATTADLQILMDRVELVYTARDEQLAPGYRLRNRQNAVTAHSAYPPAPDTLVPVNPSATTLDIWLMRAPQCPA